MGEEGADAAVMRIGTTLSRNLGRTWHLLATLAVAMVGLWVLVAHRQTIATGVDQLAVADRTWLMAAGAAATATWVCAAVVQQGAVVERLPAGRLLAAQFAASAAHHVLPAGVGTSAVNLRFLTRCGLSTATAVTALAVRTAAAGLVRLALAVVLLLVSHRTVRLSPAGQRVGLVLSVAGCGAVAALVVLLNRTVRQRAARAVRSVATDVRAVHTRWSRACALWGGSFGLALANAAVVAAVLRALEVAVPVGQVLLAYLIAGGAAVLLPTPGGLGSLDAALVFMLTAVGVPTAATVSAVLGYRLLTAWLPLFPGLLVLGLLARRSAL